MGTVWGEGGGAMRGGSKQRVPKFLTLSRVWQGFIIFGPQLQSRRKWCSPPAFPFSLYT